MSAFIYLFIFHNLYSFSLQEEILLSMLFGIDISYTCLFSSCFCFSLGQKCVSEELNVLWMVMGRLY